jgi:carbonic anhydrase/acetyltransferase-like protein (isoleucine patch superfamily)
VNVLQRISGSKPIQYLLTLVTYSLYACILGLALSPSLLLILSGFRTLLAPDVLSGRLPVLGNVVLFACLLGASLFVFYFCGLLLTGLGVRAFSLFIKPGRHPMISLCTLSWVVMSGIHTMAYRLMLPVVPMTFFAMMYFRLAGCRIGKNVWMISFSITDPYLVTIGDNTIIGGEAVLAAHVYENNHLILAPITIGNNCLVGTHSYLNPGVTLGDGAVVGMGTFVRKGTQVPPNGRIAGIAGIPTKRVFEIETGITGHGERRRRMSRVRMTGAQ